MIIQFANLEELKALIMKRDVMYSSNLGVEMMLRIFCTKPDEQVGHWWKLHFLFVLSMQIWKVFDIDTIRQTEQLLCGIKT